MHDIRFRLLEEVLVINLGGAKMSATPSRNRSLPAPTG
jgi:hypothetical protein